MNPFRTMSAAQLAAHVAAQRPLLLDRDALEALRELRERAEHAEQVSPTDVESVRRELRSTVAVWADVDTAPGTASHARKSIATAALDAFERIAKRLEGEG